MKTIEAKAAQATVTRTGDERGIGRVEEPITITIDVDPDAGTKLKNLRPVKAVPGDRVWIPDLDCRATIRSINQTAVGTSYELAWFHNGARQSAWLQADEFRLNR